MLRHVFIPSLFATLSMLTAGGSELRAAAPEIRATWLTTTSSDDWSSANLQTTMTSLKQTGFNTVYVEAWKNGYTNFTSGSLSAFTGSPSLNPTVGGRNFLNETRTAAANAGLVHGAWFEYGLMAQFGSPSNPLAVKCRDATWTVGTTSGTGWLLKDSSGAYTNPSNNFAWMNPLVPEVRALLKGIVVDAIKQFDLQVVQFDDHLAWPVQFGWDDYTRAVYKQETSRNLPSSFTDSDFLAWRQGKTQALFAEIADAAKAAKPSVVVSLAPSVIATSSASYCANWSTWLGKTDEVLPQVYRSTIASFNADWPGQITASGTSRPELGAGLRLLGTGSATPWSDLQQQIDRTRTDGALGHGIWYSEGVTVSGTLNPSNYNSQLTAYYDVAANGPAANPHFTSVRWSGTSGLGGSGTWSPLAATWKDSSTIWVQDALGIFDGAGGSVTVSGTVGVAGGLDFRAGSYTVTGGTLALRGHVRAANAVGVAAGTTATIASTLTGTTGLTKTGTGTLALAGTGTALAGGVTVQAGMLTIGAGGTTGSLAATNAITVAAGGTLGFNRTDGYGGAFAAAISGSGAIRLLSGSLALTGSQAYTGATVVSSGTLSAGAATLLATSSIAVDGGVLVATAYNPSAPLAIAASGSVAISGTGLSLGTITNAASAGRGLALTATSGTTMLAGLAGSGSTRFASHASIGTLSGGGAVRAGATLTVRGGTFAGTISGSGGGLIKSGSGTLVLAGSTGLSSPTTVGQGVLGLADANALHRSRVAVLAGGTLALSSGISTALGGLDPAAGGLTDVGNGRITVASGLAPADLVSAIAAGRSDGSWTGRSGITSRVAAALPETRAVGWLDNGGGSLTFAYAAPGDTNLDGQVDILDAANLFAGGRYDTGLPGVWLDGDVTYDGIVDILDVAGFVSTGLFDAGPYDVSPAGLVAVPEPAVPPAVLPLFALGAALVQRRRRRRRAMKTAPMPRAAMPVGSGTAATPPLVLSPAL
jgi:autotransporter-associated beta strand protein